MGTMVRESLAATDADVLSGTLLSNAGPGTYVIWASSTAIDGTISISAPGQQIANAEQIQQDAQAAVRIDQNMPWTMFIPIGGGVQPTISYVETTAGTAVIQVIHTPA